MLIHTYNPTPMRRLLPIILLCAFFTRLSVKAEVKMPILYGQHQTKQVLMTETFYDSGGANAILSRPGITAFTFIPKYGQAIEVNFSELDLKGAKHSPLSLKGQRLRGKDG